MNQNVRLELRESDLPIYNVNMRRWCEAQRLQSSFCLPFSSSAANANPTFIMTEALEQNR